MALITWSDTMSVGVERIDKEHRGLVDLVNLLHGEMLAGKSKESLGGILGKLITYTKTHFAAEEALFRAHDYPHAAEHKERARAKPSSAPRCWTSCATGSQATSCGKTWPTSCSSPARA